jgi:hypothetical protein
MAISAEREHLDPPKEAREQMHNNAGLKWNDSMSEA